MPLVVVALSIVCVAALGVSAAAAASGSIQGAAFQDLNRNGVRDPGESPFANEQLYLYDGDFQYLGTTYTDAAGHYEFTGLTDGVYHVHFASPSWWSLRHDWVPTTTGTLLPKLTVNLAITATADFGWRPIVRSSDIAAPFSSYTGPTGLRTYSYDDVVTAKDVYDAVVRGAVGAEAQYVTVRFDYGATSTTSTSWQGTPGSFSSFSAVCYDSWDSWIDQGDVGVSHEYGHAWTLYYDSIVQQEGTLDSYLKARGLYGDARINSSYAWSAREMAAEDYRQLLGSPSAQGAAQMNREIPPASEVPGLKDFFLTTFQQPSTATVPPPPPPTPPPPPPTLTIFGLTVSPTPVAKSATITFSESASARTTVTIANAKGALVRTLLSGASEPAGQVSVYWDRKSSTGQRVKSGTYTAFVTATDSSGSTVTVGAPFSVS